MAYVILGLLQLHPMSLYDLVKAFESGVSLFYSASSGSIKRALDQLVAAGFVEVTAVEDGGRGRKSHETTAGGRAHFLEWMREAPGGDLETAVLARVFFLGLLPEAERAMVLGGLRQRVERELLELESLETSVAAQEVPSGLEPVARYQRATLRYGLGSHRFAHDWLSQLELEATPTHGSQRPSRPAQDQTGV